MPIPVQPVPFFFILLRLLCLSSLSLSTAAAVDDPVFQAPPLSNLFEKLFPKVASPFSSIYFENAPFILT
jgi:hypothetical protein